MADYVIYAHDIFEGDAVGNHCIDVAAVLAGAGYDVVLAASNYAKADWRITYVDKLPSVVSAQTKLWISFSIYDSHLDELLALDCKKIFYFHGITPPELLVENAPETARLCKRGLEQLKDIGGVDIAFANSKRSLAQLSNWAKFTDIRVVPPMVDQHRVFSFSNQSCDLSSSKRSFVLAVGRVAPHKNLEQAIEVFSIMRDQNPNLFLQVTGAIDPGPYFEVLLRKAEELSVLEQIIFTGKVFEYDLVASYQRAAFFISTSLHEGFNLPVLEAMHFGVPCILRSGTAADEFAVPVCRLNDGADQGQVSLKELERVREPVVAAATENSDSLKHSVSNDEWLKIFET